MSKGKMIHVVPNAVSEVSSTPVYDLGDWFVDVDGITWEYVQVHASSTSAVAANSATYLYAPDTDYVITTCQTIANMNFFVGVGGHAIPKGYYGFVKIAGNSITVKTNLAFNADSIPTTVGYLLWGCSMDGAVGTGVAVGAASAYTGARPIGCVTVSAISGSAATGSITCEARIYNNNV